MGVMHQPLVVLILGQHSVNNTHTTLDGSLNMSVGLLDESDTGSFPGRNTHNTGIQKWTLDQTLSTAQFPSPRRFGLVP